MVILDAQDDWRFAKNVCVDATESWLALTCLPSRLCLAIPTYGSTLAALFGRTTDSTLGREYYVRNEVFEALRSNVCSLAIMDDTPRREFSPRQRHTLKEFAVGCA